MIKINFALQNFFYMATRPLEVTYVACNLFAMASTGADRSCRILGTLGRACCRSSEGKERGGLEFIQQDAVGRWVGLIQIAERRGCVCLAWVREQETLDLQPSGLVGQPF